MRPALALLLLVACGRHAAPAAPPPAEVDLLELAPKPIPETTTYLARLESRRSAVLQPDVEGQITEILVDSGEVVRAGQPVMQIYPGRQRADVAQARASRQSATATLELARTDLRRKEALYRAGAVPREEVDQARTAVDTARANVEALTQQIRGNRIELRFYRVLAPMRGVVGDIPVRVGDRVTHDTRLTTVTDNTTLLADVSIPVARVPELGPTTEVEVLGPDGAPRASGPVQFVSPRVDPATQTVLVKAQLDNRSGALRVDQMVPVRVVWRVHEGLQVPVLAVVRQAGQPFVFVAVHQDGGLVAKQRPVKLGELSDQAYEIESGLRAGDRVVTSNLQKLRDGAPITPARR